MVSRLKILVRALAAKESRDRREFRIFCNSPLPEKRFALEAGIGLQGKNSLIYLPGEGSFFILGGILFPPGAAHPRVPSVQRDRPGEICGSCTACREACPGGAISVPGTIDRRRCIQGRTAVSGPLPPFLRNNWGTVLYGCDICQKVCPLNGNPPDAAETNFGVLGPALPLEKILAPRDGELGKTIFRGTVLDRTWIAETAIKRNAVLSAAALKAMELRPLIEPYGKHPEEGLREAALWALGRL
jgi:epoxyqueuosine reductase